MNTEVSNNNTFVLPEILDIGSCEETYEAMREFSNGEIPVATIDTGVVSSIDMSGIQLLLAFVEELKSKSTEIVWENYSVQVFQMADELGLADVLDS